MKSKTALCKIVGYGMTAIFTLAVVSCGGGGGSPGVSGFSSGTSASTPGSGELANDPTLLVSIVDGNGAVTSSLSGGQDGTVRATVKDGSGAAAANAVVNFTATDSFLVQFTPVSASALTDANGVAVVSVKPKDFTSAGALTIQATSTVGAKTATGSVNLAVGAAPLTVGALSVSPVPSGPLPAFSTVTVNVPVTSNGQPVTTAPGLTLTSLCKGDGTADLVLGSIVNGVQSATYTNKGCLRGTDVITASVGTSTQQISIAVDSANIGTIQFVGSNLTGTSIVLKGSGGLGRTEAAQLTFKVVDQNNAPLAGVDVAFHPTTTTGGLSVLPANATTDVNGTVTTTVSAGTIPTPVRVIAEAVRNGVTISGLSDALTISTGLPIQKFMSLSVDKYNIEGLNYDGVTANITVLLADQYGNPVSDNTTINFVAEGGAVGSSVQGACNTTDGGCTVSLKSQAFKPGNGRVTVLAYAQGLEDFIDANGDGQYSCTNFTDTNGNVPTTYRPLVDICQSGGELFTDMSDPFLDAGSLGATSGVSSAGTLDGAFEPSNSDLPIPFNGNTYSGTPNGKWGINYIRSSAEIVFSGSAATLIRQVCDTAGNCRDWVNATDGDPSVIQGVAGAGCAAKLLTFRLVDVNNNPLPSGTSVKGVDSIKIAPQTFFPASVPSTNSIGGTFHRVSVKPDDACVSGSFGVSVTTPKGDSSAFFFTSN